MDMLENVGAVAAPTETIAPISNEWEQLDDKKQYWVDYRACNGIRFTEDGRVLRMTVEECADILGVSAMTLYRWEKTTPRFTELKAMRRKQKYGDKIVDKIWAAAAIKAAAGELGHVELILRNFDPDFKSPKQTNELEIGDGLADLFNKMQQRTKVIYGDGTQPGPTPMGLDSGQRPEAV